MKRILTYTGVVRKNPINKLGYAYHIILYICSFCDFYISIGQFRFKLFYIISIPALILSASNVFKGKLTKIDLLFLLWIFVSLFALDVTLSVNDVLVCMMGELILFLLYKDVQFFLKRYNIPIFKTINFVSKIILVFCLYGLLQYFLFRISGINIGVSHLTMFPRPRSIFSEPDWLGFYSCVGSSLFLIKIIYRSNNLKFNWFGLLVCFLTMLLSFTRAAWVSFAFGALVLLILAKGLKKRRLICLISISVFIGFLLLVFLSITNVAYIEQFLTRINPLQWSSNDGGASDTRKYSIEIMLYYIKINPIFGNGSGSMNYISTNTDLLSSLGYYYQINAGRGNANILLATLFDIGIVGFIIFFSLIISLYSKCLSLNKSKKADANFLGIISIVVFWNFMIDFQFNNGIRFATIWLFFGIIVFYTRTANARLESSGNRRVENLSMMQSDACGF